MSEKYTGFAEVYDELMDNVPYAEWAETLADMIEQYGISKPVSKRISEPADDSHAETEKSGNPPQDGRRHTKQEALESERNLVLDLGCGTGTMAELLYQKGYDVIGVDNAPAMLDIALKKREINGSEILYLQQDMRELELFSTVGTVISVCDCLNYLLEEEELLEVFRRVNNYLYPGGLFIFDFITEYKYHEVMGEMTIAENREDCSFIWENYYDVESGINEYDVTVFVREEEELFRRFEETHMQRGYTLEKMINLTKQAGLQVIGTLDADTHGPVTDQSERIYILAQECQKTGIEEET